MDPTFEVIRFQVAPAGSDVAIIELEGRPADPGTLGARIQLLLLENPVERLELRPIVEPDGAGDGVLRATFAAPLELAADAATTYALSTGRGPLLELPVPDGVGDTGLEVRLARTVNALRGELSDARRRLGSIVGTVRGEVAAEREDTSTARAETDAAARAAAADRERLESEVADAQGALDDMRVALAQAHARISELEATLIVPRAPRVPRGPGPRPPRPPRRNAETEEHDPVVRRTHSSLGRSTARTAMLIALAVVLVIIVVVVLQVRVLT